MKPLGNKNKAIPPRHMNHTTYVSTTKKEIWENIIWLSVLIIIIILNSAILCTVCLTIRKCSKRKVVQKAVYHSIVSSNFAANMVYSSGRVAEKLLIHQKQPSTHSITTISFFKSLGEMACITGVVSLSLIQFLKLRKLNINNKIINFFDTKNCSHRTRKFAWPIAIWTFSGAISTSTLCNNNIVESMRNGVLIVGICLTVIFSYKVVTIINRHRRNIRCRSISSQKTANIAKSQSLLKGNCVLVTAVWLPTLIGQCVIKNLYKRSGNPGFKILTKTAMLFCIAHPILYLATNRDIRQVMVKRFIKCQSREEEMDEEFYMRLRVRRRFRRSIQIQPFVVTKDDC